MNIRYFGSAILASFFLSSAALALPCDGRGSSWSGRMQVGAVTYNFELRRQSCAPASPWNFDVLPSSPDGKASRGQAMVWLNGRRIVVKAISGTATGCALTLNGIYAARDVTNGQPYRGSGTAICAATGIWSAVIR